MLLPPPATHDIFDARAGGGWRHVGVRIRRILRSRLPERLPGRLPPLLVEFAVGITFPLLMVALRLALVPLFGEQAPFALVFVGVVGAAVVAGWRAGLLALLVGQLLTWYLLIEGGGDVDHLRYLGGLLLAAVSQAVALVIVALYQREVDRVSHERETQMGLLERALKEIDHRTVNNYQTVLAVVLAQAKAADSAEVRHALTQVADRIRAIATASRQLALSSESLEEVRVADHLQELCAQIERGLSRDGVRLDYAFDDIAMSPVHTTCVSIILNELVTNALKHAFPDGHEGTIRVRLTETRKGCELTIEDDGVGIGNNGHSRGGGLGSRLVDMFAKQLRARHQVEAGAPGTRHRLAIPRPARGA